MCFTRDNCHQYCTEKNTHVTGACHTPHLSGMYSKLLQHRQNLKSRLVRHKEDQHIQTCDSYLARATKHMVQETQYINKQTYRDYSDRVTADVLRKSQADHVCQSVQNTPDFEESTHGRISITTYLITDQTKQSQNGIATSKATEDSAVGLFECSNKHHPTSDADDDISNLFRHVHWKESTLLPDHLNEGFDNKVTAVKPDCTRRASCIVFVDKATGNHRIQPVWIGQCAKYTENRSSDSFSTNQNTESVTASQMWQSLMYLKYRPFHGRSPAVISPGSPEYEEVKCQLLTVRTQRKPRGVRRSKRTQTGRGQESYNQKPGTHFYSAYRFYNSLHGKQWVVLPAIKKQ